MSRVDVWRMIRRRANDAGLSADICCHTFLATGITAYLKNRGPPRKCAADGGARKPPYDQLYDQTGDEIMLDEVERITISFAREAIMSGFFVAMGDLL